MISFFCFLFLLFNDALNAFYLRLYGFGHMVKGHSDSETLAGTRNSSMGPPHEGSIRRPIAPWANALTAVIGNWSYEVVLFYRTIYEGITFVFKKTKKKHFFWREPPISQIWDNLFNAGKTEIFINIFASKYLTEKTHTQQKCHFIYWQFFRQERQEDEN